MSNSLRVKLSKLRYKGQISTQEYNELISKLEGHDREIRNKAIDEVVKIYKSKTSMENKLIDEIAEQLKGGGVDG